jgi:putative ABC transport system permease protein
MHRQQGRTPDLRFAIRHALRESRSAWRSLAPYMLAITLGVAALVAVQSFREGVVETVQSESQVLLGADVRLRWSSELADSAASVIDSIVNSGIETARVTETLSVAFARNGRTRLVQVRAHLGAFPFYGEVVTVPQGLWPPDPVHPVLLAESSVLTALDAGIGDSVSIGRITFRIGGVVTRPPLEIGFQSALAPRVFIAEEWLEDAGLIQFGSLFERSIYARLGPGQAQSFEQRNEDRMRGLNIGVRTAAEQGEDLAEAFSVIARFLGLVGLAALLLGGLGVASAVNVFVREKRSIIATLRCLGATQRTTFAAYLLQAAALGFIGATTGAFLGVALQGLLPALLGDILPIEIGFRVRWLRIIVGIAIGTSVAFLFALLPMLEIRGITPLQALRYTVDPVPVKRDRLRVVAWAALSALVLMLAVLEAPDPIVGIWFAVGLAVALGILRAIAAVLLRQARRFVSPAASFPVRQGLASLSRPGNQTVAVMVSLGFGVFLLATVLAVQAALLGRLDVSRSAAAPDLIAFDIQSDQIDALERVFEQNNLAAPAVTPIVTARIASINGTPVGELIDAGRESGDIEPWTLRREYRNTYRDALTESERLVDGEMWTGPRAAGSLPRISIETELAGDMGVGIGDTITWDVQGALIATRVASLRVVDWARLDTNFFVVFEPGVLESAPQTFVALARIDDEARSASLQRDLAVALPNVSTLDLSLVQETLARIVSQVTRAIRFMGLFCVAAGILVLVGALFASRAQRVKESVLLRTLGATRSQIRRVLLTEYAALGILAGLSGVALGGIAAIALLRFVFDVPFAPAFPSLLGLWLGTALLAVAIGAAGSRGVLRRPPLAVLRDVAG